VERHAHGRWSASAGKVNDVTSTFAHCPEAEDISPTVFDAS